MTAKEYLCQIKRIETRLKAMSEQLVCLKSAAEYLAPSFSDMPKPSMPNIHKNENAIIRVMDWEQRMEAEYGRLADINAAINSVPDPQLQSLLVKRYVNGYSWATISRELFVGSSRVYQLHKAALAEIEKIMDADG